MRRLLLLLVFAGCGPPAAEPKWHVAGNALRAPDGRAAILRGVNLGSQKNMPYLGWATEDDYRRVRGDFGMNAIRFSPEGGVVWMKLQGDGAKFAFTVRDQGPAIPEQDRAPPLPRHPHSQHR